MWAIALIPCLCASSMIALYTSGPNFALVPLRSSTQNFTKSGLLPTSSRTAARASSGVDTSWRTSVANIAPPLSPPGVGEGAAPLLVADPDLDVVAIRAQRLEHADAVVGQAPQVVEHVLPRVVRLVGDG